MPLNGLYVSVKPDSAADAPPNTYMVRVRATNLNRKLKVNGSSTVLVST